MGKRKLLLIISVVVMWMTVFYGIRDIYDMSYRNSHKSVDEEEMHVSSKLPPGTVVIHTGERSGSIQKSDRDLVLGAVMRVVLACVFFAWGILKYRQEKQAEEFAAKQKRRNKQREINIMLDKEKRWKEYGKDEK